MFFFWRRKPIEDVDPKKDREANKLKKDFFDTLDESTRNTKKANNELEKNKFDIAYTMFQAVNKKGDS